MIKAGALYYSVFVAFIVTLLCGFFIVFHYLNNQYWLNQLQRDKAKLEVESVINIFKIKPDEFPHELNYKYNIDQEMSATISRSIWGAYDVLNVTSSFKTYRYEKTVLTGGYDIYPDSIALYLADHNKYLSLGGDALLNGNCVLPRLGVRRTYLEGKGYNKQRLVYGKLDTSTSHLPGIDLKRLAWIRKYMQKEFSRRDSVVFIDKIENDKVLQPFNQKTLVIFFDEFTGIDLESIKGNVIIISDEKMFLDSDDQLEEIIVIAPEIIVKSGFHGNVQLFASKGIIIEKDAKIDYPGYCAILSDELKTEPYFMMNEESKVYGGILYHSNAIGKQNLQAVILKENSHIYGDVYVNRGLEHRGVIYGKVAVDKFVLKTKNANYENVIFNGIIDYDKLNDHFVHPLFFNYLNMEVIKCLN